MIPGQNKPFCSGLLLAALPLLMVAQESVEVPAKPGPPPDIYTLGGKVLKVQSLKGKVVLLDFMTTTCPTCKMASASLQRLYLELGPKGFYPVAVALDVNSPTPLRNYGQEHGLTFTLGTALRSDVASYVQHPPDKPFLVPTLVLLDRKGRISAIEVGWKGEGQFRAAIVKLLAK